MKKIMLVVAPVGHLSLTGVNNPKSPEELALDIIECSKAGAGMVHLHVRDRDGNLTSDTKEFSRTIGLVREQSDIIIQGSTGGVPKGGVGKLSLEERCTALDDPRVEVGALNMGSVNFGDDPFINSGTDIRYWALKMKESDIIPEMEIFEGGMLSTVKRIAEEGYIAPPFLCAFCPGYSIPANTDTLFFLKSMLPNDSIWGVNHQKMEDFSLIAASVSMGASYVRVGFEDSVYYAPGRIAKTNAELISRVGNLIKKMGFEIASPQESKKILGIKK